jgi:myosin regulatory light chain 12
VSERDLKEIFSNLGITPNKATLDGLLSDRPGAFKGTPIRDPDDRGINFTMFLTMMGEHLFEFDVEAELIGAFECFDEQDTGMVKCDEIRKWMEEAGERMDPHEIDRFLKGPFTDRQGNFNYREWVKVLRVNEEEEAEAQ